MEPMAQTPQIGRDAIRSLLALVSFLAHPDQTPPAITPIAQAVLLDRDTFEWVRKEFEGITDDDETLWPIAPYRVFGDITQETVALAIGPASGTAQDATRFYYVENGRVYPTELEEDQSEVEAKRDTTLAWKLLPALRAQATDWDIASRRAARTNVLANQGRAPDDATRKTVLMLMADEVPTWEDLFAAYMALDIDPAALIGHAIGSTRPA
jgi:hypothetical protein